MDDSPVIGRRPGLEELPRRRSRVDRWLPTFVRVAAMLAYVATIAAVLGSALLLTVILAAREITQ